MPQTRTRTRTPYQDEVEGPTSIHHIDAEAAKTWIYPGSQVSCFLSFPFFIFLGWGGVGRDQNNIFCYIPRIRILCLVLYIVQFSLKVVAYFNQSFLQLMFLSVIINSLSPSPHSFQTHWWPCQQDLAKHSLLPLLCITTSDGFLKVTHLTVAVDPHILYLQSTYHRYL